MASDAASLGERGTRAAMWGYAGALGGVLLTLVSQAILARTVGAAEFGVFAAGALVMSFAIYFADFGVGLALVNKDEPTDEDVRFAFTLQVLIGVVAAGIVAAAAWPAAAFFKAPGVAPVLLALACALFFTSCSATALNLLKRELDYRAMNLCLLTSMGVGLYGVAIPLALLGWGALSMAIGWAAQSAAYGLLMYRLVRHPLRPLLRHADGKWMLEFGTASFATLLLRFGANNVDRALVGRAFSSADLAMYTSPFNLLQQPLNRVLATLQGLAFATSSRQMDDRPSMAIAYLAVIEVSMLLFAPVFLSVMATSTTVMTGVYGPEWHDAGAICVAACVAMLALTVNDISVPYLWGIRRGVVDTRVQVVALVAVIVGTLLALDSGPVATAWTVAGLYVLRAAWIAAGAAREIDRIETQRLLKALRPGFVVGVPLAALLFVWDRWLLGTSLPATARLGAVVALAAPVYGALLFASRGLLSQAVRGQAARFGRRFGLGG